MTVQITIIGLGQIGASIGMALKGRKNLIRRVGYDKDAAVWKAAESLEAVDEVRGLPGAVKEAQVVLLCLPLGEIYRTLKRIGPDLMENAVVMDTAPIKSKTFAWARELLPQGRFYLGLVPALNPEALSSSETGLHAARPDLFQRTVMVVDAPQGTPAEVEGLAFDLVRLLGAKPMLADPAESDGLMTTVHLLPQLTAAALLNATVDGPGWAEARKLAGRPFSSVTGGMAYYDDPSSLKEAALGNRLNMVHALDVMLAALKGLRDDIEKGDEAGVSERLGQAFEARERWLTERESAGWLSEGGDAAEIPDAGERMRQMFFGGTAFDRSKHKKK